MKLRSPRSLVYSLCIMIFCIGLFSSAVVFAAGEDDAQVREIRERIVRGAGGAEALRAVNAIQVEGAVIAIVRGDSGRYERIWARGGRLRADTKYGRSTELRLLNGSRGWRGRHELSLMDARGSHMDAMLYQYRVLDLPFGIADGRYVLKLVRKEQLNGAEVDVVQLVDPPLPEVYVYIDGEGRIVKSTGMFMIEADSQPQQTSLSAEFSDFRTVDGLVVPYAITFYAKDMKIAELTIETCVLNPDLSKVKFQPQVSATGKK